MPVPYDDHDGCVICAYNNRYHIISIHYPSFDPEPYLSENGERSEHPGAPDDGPSKWFEPRTRKQLELAGVLS